jgi:hypothetical protein
MKAFWMAAALAGALAACSQGGVSGSEDELAAKIVDVGGVLNIDEATIKQVVDGHTQMIAMQRGNLTPAQAEQISAGIKANIDAALPDLKKEMAGQLVEIFEPKELAVFLAFVAAEEHESIKQKIAMVTQQSLAAADEMTMKAVDKAVADAKLPPPVDPTQPAVPGVVKPNNPQQ